jgi:multimeric flavodoxin WrbA
MPDSAIVSKPKLLAIAGSPRRGGNTDRLLDQAVSGAAARGALVKQVTLSDLDIAPCQHCDGCIQTGGICAVIDDMDWILQDLRDYDRFILAAPVFFMGVPAQAKAMIDRCQALWVVKYLLKQPVATNKESVRKGAFISVGGSNYKDLFAGSVATVKSWYTTLDIQYSESLLLPGIDNYHAVTKHASALKDAFTIGQNIVST